MERPLTDIGPVLAWDANPFNQKQGGAVIFLCPCGGREVYVTSPPHGIEFDQDGRLTLKGSVGSRPVGPAPDFRRVHGEDLSDLPQNWCHFHVSGGRATMCDDAKCPGGAG